MGGLEDSMLKTLPYMERVKISNSARPQTASDIRSCFGSGFKNPKQFETESAITLFSEKGKFSRLGVYITHLSILIILIGGLI